MVDIADVHRRALDATGKIVAGVKPEHLKEATPCDEWDVAMLLNHVVGGNLWAAELAGGKTIDEVGDRLDGDVLGGDPSAAYAASARLAAAAFEAPGALEAPCAVSYGPVPGEVYAGHRFLDVLIHGWDLAIATSQDALLDPELVDACIDVIAPQADMLAASGMFGVDMHVPADASTQTRLLAMLGRQG